MYNAHLNLQFTNYIIRLQRKTLFSGPVHKITGKNVQKNTLASWLKNTEVHDRSQKLEIQGSSFHSIMETEEHMNESNGEIKATTSSISEIPFKAESEVLNIKQESCVAKMQENNIMEEFDIDEDVDEKARIKKKIKIDGSAVKDEPFSRYTYIHILFRPASQLGMDFK